MHRHGNQFVTTCALKMSTSDVFSLSVKYKFKTGFLSISSFVVFILNILVIVLPLIIAYQTGGNLFIY